MLEIFVIAFCIYFAFNIYTSFMQIGFIKDARNLKAIILDSNKYLEAADYAIEKEKLALASTFYDFVLFILWIGFGLSYLDSLVQIDSYWLKAIVFVDLFIIINWILTLPFELYSTFKLNKKYEFSNITPVLFIKDTIKTGVLFLVFGSLVIAGISFIINNFPSWWIFGFVFIFAVIILINMLYPVIRDKMFDKFEKLKDKELEEKIEKLLDEVGFKSSGVFSVDA
ncbi:M48 family peptidase, partial [Aliarcobacter butzleri]